MSYLPSRMLIEEFVRHVLREDLTYADITTESIVDEDKIVEATVNFRQAGIICGLPFFEEVYRVLNPDVKCEFIKNEGQKVQANTDVVKISGPAKAILTGERSALNILQKASGIATITNTYVEKIKDTKARITDTRKTTPGCRILEKYSITIGGASPHRYNLSESILIKDNHIECAGSITEAVKRVRSKISHVTKIEVETENEAQVREALKCHVDIIMLDNMPPYEMKAMVDLINGAAIVEASGNVNLDTLYEIAKTGVDYISTSAITIKAPVLDIGMDFKPSVIYL